MDEEFYIGIRDLLKEDSTIQTLLGGKFVFISHVSQPNQIPSITILESDESSTPRSCYATFKERDNVPIVQIDAWSYKSLNHVVKIAKRIDTLLFATGVANTQSWRRISSSDQFEKETGIHHKALRYTFAYKVTDS